MQQRGIHHIKMVKVKIGECDLYVDGNLKGNLDFYKKRVNHNFDFVGLVIGDEGTGKTELTEQLALYYDPEFNLDKYVYSIEQFDAAVDSAAPYSCILWDESDEIDSSNMRKILVAIKRKFKRIRSKNLFIWLVTPTFFDLNKYFVMHRVQCLVRVYAKGVTRGSFMFYTKRKLQLLYIKGYKEWNLNAVKSDFFGSFTKKPKGFPIQQEDIQKKKDDSTSSIFENMGKTKREMMQEYRVVCVDRLYKWLKRRYNITPTQEDVANVFGMTQATISLDRSIINTNKDEVVINSSGVGDEGNNDG